MGQGTIRLLRDNVSQLKASYSYDAYGNRQCIMPGGPTGCSASTSFGYTGQYQDNESGLVYMRARYYDPFTQQFISTDPMPSGQPYVYAGGSSTNATDPTGLWLETAIVLASLGQGAFRDAIAVEGRYNASEAVGVFGVLSGVVLQVGRVVV